MKSKANFTDLHTQFYSLSLVSQHFLSLVLLFNTAEVLPHYSLQHAPLEKQCFLLLFFYPAQSKIHPSIFFLLTKKIIQLSVFSGTGGKQKQQNFSLSLNTFRKPEIVTVFHFAFYCFIFICQGLAICLISYNT